LLAVDQSGFNKERRTDECIAQILDIDRSRIYRVKRDCVEHSLEDALTRRIAERGHRPCALDGEQEARLIVMTYGEPPEGRARWTVRLLAEHLVELKIVDEISYSTVSRVLKIKEIKPWLRKEWVIPPEQNGAFVAAMENVIDVYTRPEDPAYPVVCMDEMPKQLSDECREAYRDDHEVEYFDTEYVRCGTTNVFMTVDPLVGKRMVKVFEHKTRQDFAHFVENIAAMYPNAKRITLVCDNLNTHDFGSLYETFDPEKPHALMRSFECKRPFRSYSRRRILHYSNSNTEKSHPPR